MKRDPKSCGGKWGSCPNAFKTLDRGYPVMRCKLTDKHPDDCRGEPA